MTKELKFEAQTWELYEREIRELYEREIREEMLKEQSAPWERRAVNARLQETYEKMG